MSNPITQAKSKLRFEISGYYFIALFALALLGFWPSYFVKFFDGTADFEFYIHFHATLMILWVCMLIIQPILIHNKKLTLHRVIGRLSYVLFPLILISVVLAIHQIPHEIDEPDLDISLFGQFRPFLIFIIAYFIAIKYRYKSGIHARAMIATGICMIEPALTRLTLNAFGAFNLFTSSPNLFIIGSLITISIIFLLSIGLIVSERTQTRDRWVFPLILGLYFAAYFIAMARIHIGLESLAKWFVSLPLT